MTHAPDELAANLTPASGEGPKVRGVSAGIRKQHATGRFVSAPNEIIALVHALAADMAEADAVHGQRRRHLRENDAQPVADEMDEAE